MLDVLGAIFIFARLDVATVAIFDELAGCNMCREQCHGVWVADTI